MHQLFRLVLGQKDLSRAGDLFSLDDSEIEDSLTEALEQIKIISSSPDYHTSNNDQAVVEVCITRITTAIRETGSIEKHAEALVGLWDACLEHSLRPLGKEEDAPHASDIMSCILQNYHRPPVAALAVPIAVKFLPRSRQDLCRNLSNYLSLAAIADAEPLAGHTEAVVSSVLRGNVMLLRVLPAVYEKQPQPINRRLSELLALMSQLEPPEQYHLLQLLHVAAKRKHAEVVQKGVPFLIKHLKDSAHNDTILNILLEIASYEPLALTSFLPVLKETGEKFPYLIGQTARIYGVVGRVDEERARSCLLCLVTQLASLEHSCHYLLLLEIKGLTEAFSSILGPQSRDIFCMSNSFATIAKLLLRQLESAKAEINRSRSLALHTLLLRDVGSDDGEEEERTEPPTSLSLSEINQRGHRSDRQSLETETHWAQLRNSPASQPSITQAESENLTETVIGKSQEVTASPTEYQDKLYLHLKENLSAVKAYALEITKRVPIPDQCTIEDTVRSCVAKLFFSCSLRGQYCLYSKSSFTLISPEPRPWIQIMFLFQQSLFPEPLSLQSRSVQLLRALWEKTQAGDSHSFETAMTESTFPQQKALDQVQLHLEEVRFFDVFGFSEAAGAWQCFMCNNPEKASVVNQDGQPLMEGKLKEKQVRWKFIKRWKTRYFTLAGNQLLFQKGKSKEDPDDAPIELSKVQSVKAVVKTRRDRALPRAFEIFTDNKTYVLKAKDEKNAGEWLQCIHVAVAQARERESREVTTYL